MRTRIAAGNWKMNTNLEEGVQLAQKINDFMIHQNDENKRVILGVPFTHIVSLVNTVDFRKISIAAQNCAKWEKGAYT
ncbi:MAG TPA: triose-phosphate isomerase, partial [Bacteroidales bacterium]|nr:triose-phosphate isomerase [Bacteroidales bacterium]